MAQIPVEISDTQLEQIAADRIKELERKNRNLQSQVSKLKGKIAENKETVKMAESVLSEVKNMAEAYTDIHLECYW